MEKIEIQKKDVEVVTDIICDCCGQSCKTSVDYEYMTLEARWGYGTKKDMEKWTAHLCEKCVDEKLSFINFKKEDLQFQTVIGTDREQEEQINEHELRYNNDNEKKE